MTLHPILTMQLADDRRAALTAAAGRRRRAEPAPASIPSPGTAAFAAWAAAFGDLVADRGLDDLERQVGTLCRIARRHGASTTATAILADRQQPDVARHRALGLVLVALAAPVPMHSAATDVA